MRGYKFISIKEKVLIVSQVIAGEKIQLVADKHRVSRPSVYTWAQRALGALEEALRLEKRGPKSKRAKFDARDKVIEEQKKEIGRLKDIIEKEEKQIENLRRKMNLHKKDIFRPLKCPHCGFEKIYKNGTYKIKAKRFLDELKKGEEKEIIIQQFICPYCKSTVHPPEKKRIIIFL